MRRPTATCRSLGVCLCPKLLGAGDSAGVRCADHILENGEAIKLSLLKGEEAGAFTYPLGGAY